MVFTINSNRYNELENKFLAIAKYIKNTIDNKRPILIKHHNDCDGYSAAIAIEMAIRMPN